MRALYVRYTLPFGAKAHRRYLGVTPFSCAISSLRSFLLLRALRFRTNGVTITECWLFDHSQHLVAKHGTTATRSTMNRLCFYLGSTR